MKDAQEENEVVAKMWSGWHSSWRFSEISEWVRDGQSSWQTGKGILGSRESWSNRDWGLMENEQQMEAVGGQLGMEKQWWLPTQKKSALEYQVFR